MKNNKITKKNVSGILLLDKQKGVTSNGALQRVKYLFSAVKAGHTGSLDPLATGMLPICFGDATKLSQYLLNSDKQYDVSIKLGIQTTTGDAEGEVTLTRPVPALNEDELKQVLQQFTGPIQQIPPMYSAIKHHGKPLYELARKGIEIERAPRLVHIYRLKQQGFQENILDLNVFCSKGTYIRTLAEDIGERLGCGAYVCGLRRISVSPYQDCKMFTFSELEQIYETQGLLGLYQLLLPLESSVSSLPAVTLSASSAFYMRMGQPVMLPHLPPTGFVRFFANDGGFIGVGEMLEDGRVAPRRLVLPQQKNQVVLQTC